MRAARRILATTLILMMALTMTQIPAFADETAEESTFDTTTTISTTESEPASSSEVETTPTSSSEPATQPATKPTTTTTTTSPTSVAPKVKVTVKGPGLKVTWNAVNNADYYEVYRSYSSGSRGSKLKKVSGKTVYIDNAVKSGKKAFYSVRAHIPSRGYTVYSAKASNTIYRVYIETGHGIDSRGRWDSGCTWKKYQEAKLMIPICKSATKYLRARGVYVYTDAFSGNNRNLTWLMKHLKGYNVSVLLNVHCDYKGAPKGTQPLYRYSEQKKLAKCLNAGVHKTVKIKNRGLKKRTDLQSLNKTKSYCTACLFETGNIKKDNKILRKKSDAYGKGLAMGVCKYLGVKW